MGPPESLISGWRTSCFHAIAARAVRHFGLTKSLLLLCPATARRSAKFEHAAAKIIAHALTIADRRSLGVDAR